MPSNHPLNLDLLGPAALDTAALADIAAAALHEPAVTITSVEAAVIEMPVLNMTTGGLWRVRGTARARSSRASGEPAGEVPFSAVVKLIQSPLLWAGIEQVPPAMRGELARRYPWRTEAQVYASELANALPSGGRLPDIYSILELDPQRIALWMEDVTLLPDAPWSDATFAQAARWLGRLAGSRAVRDLGPTMTQARDADRLRFYLEGVGRNVFIPGIEGDEMWQLPAVAAAATTELVAGLRALARRSGQLVDEIVSLPALPAHGDASPQNILMAQQANGPSGPAEFVVIDWGMYGTACAGFDLGQLLAGWVNQGAMRGRELFRLEPLCLAAYCNGLAQSGVTLEESVVRRGHALSMAIFTGLSTVTDRRLAEPDSADLHDYMAGRLEMATFVLNLLAETD